jgi:hypothetical protein
MGVRQTSGLTSGEVRKFQVEGVTFGVWVG